MLSFVTALAISTQVERAVIRSAGPAVPPVAGRAQIAAELQSIRNHLRELKPSGRGVAELEEILDHACARREEWTA
jgi:hypothetical protein